MTPRETAIKVMARANDPVGWAFFDKPMKPEFDKVKARFQASQIKNMAAALDALLAALPGVGLKVVPLVATEDQVEAGWIDKEDVNPDDIYIKMLAASTNPLEKQE